jgi:RNA recognition motif-containing protein
MDKASRQVYKLRLGANFRIGKLSGAYGNKIYVGGLPFAVTDKRLEEIFSAHGKLESVQVITDKFTGRSKGLGLSR